MKKFLFILVLLLFTLPVLAKKTILIVGDSLSAGYGLEPNQGWVTLLQKRLDKQQDYQVINISISGHTTSDGLMQLPKALQTYHPVITIIELGGNDGLRGLQLSTINNNLQEMISLLKKANSKILLLGVRLPPNYGLMYTKEFQNILSKLAVKNSIAIVPLFLNTIDENPALMSADQIHPNVKAQPKILDNVWRELEKLL
jgi:acyl-CoA thioesterase-1